MSVVLLRQASRADGPDKPHAVGSTKGPSAADNLASAQVTGINAGKTVETYESRSFSCATVDVEAPATKVTDTACSMIGRRMGKRSLSYSQRGQCEPKGSHMSSLSSRTGSRPTRRQPLKQGRSASRRTRNFRHRYLQMLLV